MTARTATLAAIAMLWGCGGSAAGGWRAGDAQRHVEKTQWTDPGEENQAMRAASACDRGDGIGCVLLGNLFVGKPDGNQLQDFFYARGCELDGTVDQQKAYNYALGSCDSVLDRIR